MVKEGVGVGIDGGNISAVVARDDVELGDATATTSLGSGSPFQRLHLGFDAVARRVVQLAGAGVDRPWLVAVSSQVGSEHRSVVRDAAHAAGVRNLCVIAASSAMASALTVPPSRAVTVWWGSDGLDVGIVRMGLLAGHGGGTGLATDGPLRMLGAQVVANDVADDGLRAAGAWAAAHSLRGDRRADGLAVPPWDQVLDLWQESTDAAVDLIEEAVDAVDAAERPDVAHLAGDVGPIAALRAALTASGRWRAEVEDRSIASIAAALAVRRLVPVRRCGLDLGVQADRPGGRGMTRIIDRNSPLPIHRELLLGALDPALPVHRVLVHEMWGPEIAASRPVVDLEVPADGSDRFRLEVDVDPDGVVSASCRPLS